MIDRRGLRSLGILAVALLHAAGAWGQARGPESFLASAAYRDGEEVVGVLLTDEEYARMIEGVEYRGVRFDWSWYEADYAEPRRPSGLRFRVADYGTVRVGPVTNHSPAVAPGLAGEVRRHFVRAMERLGLRVAAEGEQATLGLDVAIVDYEAERASLLVAGTDPFIELEIRLRDLATGKPLLLVRNQDHNSTPLEGAEDTAGALVRVLQ